VVGGEIRKGTCMSQSDSSRLPVAGAPGAWAAMAPVLCAAHCVAAPLLVLVVPAAAVGSTAERVLWGATALLAAGFLAWSIRAHRQGWVAVPVVAGLALWGAGLFDLVPASETLTTVVGALLVSGGMVASAWLRHRRTCGDCGCPAHG
jgi:hypothetical protein